MRLDAAQATAQADPGSGVAGGGGPPDPPVMDALVARMDGLDGRLRSVETGLAGVGGKIDALSTSVVGKLPTVWQIPAVVGATAATLATIAGIFAAVLHRLHVG